MRHIRQFISRQSTRTLFGVAVFVFGGVAPDPAAAQRPFRVHDPFYRGETARRSFFDGYAFTTEVSYRTPGAVQDGQQTFAQDPLGLSFRLDYQLSPTIDIGAILDASGSNTGRSLGVSWLTFKYYQTEENTDYAFRLAVDPAIDGRVGAPQVDAAFLSTTLLSPSVSTDYALGVRRVRMGYEQLVPQDGTETPTFPENPRSAEFIFTRAIGWELHAMTQYSVLLNPARNNVFVSGLLYVGKYDIVETKLDRSAAVPPPPSPGAAMTSLDAMERAMEQGSPITKEHFGGAVWIRSGIEYNRPSFQVMPFLNFAIKRWVDAGVERSPRLSLGLRFMIR